MATRTTTSLPDVTQLDVAEGNWAPSNERGPIHSIVLHTMVGTVEGAAARFNTPNSQVSAHYGVGIDGRLYQWCDEDNVAYHAGNWVVNCTSIGIEHEDGTNPDTNPTGYNNPRSDALYEASAKLVADICTFYNFPADKDHIFRHQDVIDKSVYKGGTACPDALDTDRIISMAQAILNPPPVVPETPIAPSQPETPVVEQPSEPETGPDMPAPQSPIEPIAPETVPVVTDVPSQPDTNPVSNTPLQTETTNPEANSGISGQAGKVPLDVLQPIESSNQSKLVFLNWFIELVVFVGRLIGIEKKQ